MGDQPPNTLGSAFVHDPKLANGKAVKAQVKLWFTRCKRARCEESVGHSKEFRIHGQVSPAFEGTDGSKLIEGTTISRWTVEGHGQVAIVDQWVHFAEHEISAPTQNITDRLLYAF